MNNKKLIFFGDSHVSYLSGDQNVRLIQSLAKQNSENWPKQFSIGKYQVEDKIFFWKNAGTAWSLTVESLKEMIDEDVLNPGDVCFFIFGSVDLVNKLVKFKNTKELVHKYVTECLMFCKMNNTVPIFVSPLYNGNSDQYNIFIKCLTEECLKNKIFAPIVLSDNAISRFYVGDDMYNHLNEDDSKKALDYIIKEFYKHE